MPWEWLPDVGWQDVVDIALVSTLVYTVIVLVRRTRAAFVAIGIVMLGALYIAARAIDLRLTALLLQGFFAVLVVILVVIFQEELRQLFESIALSGLRRRGERPAQFDPTDVLVRCLADFAAESIGALVVLPGRQPISRHVQGGVELDGRISAPLLKSLFDPHSPGHDGAVILENDRASRYSVHLPLSTDFQQLAGMGTRHSAALGLAELTDALCLVVSEERGQVSVAHQGRILRLRDPHEVGAVIREFLETVHPSRQNSGGWIKLLRENWVEKLASVALVIGLWYLFVPGSRPTTFVYSVPVEVDNLPANYVLESIDPPEVTVVFTGLRRAFYLLDPEDLSVRVDASLVKQGRRTFRISEEDVRHPEGLSLEEIDPGRIKISVQPGGE